MELGIAAMLVVRVGVTVRERTISGDGIFLFLDCSGGYRNLYIHANKT